MGGKAQCPPKYALVSTFRPIKVLMVDFQKKGLDKKVFVVRDEALYFSEALDFSLPSLLVNPALAGVLCFPDTPIMCLRVSHDIDAVIWVKNT